MSILALMGFLGICFLAALSGALFRPGEWHRQLAKPSWNPPNWVFAPAWTVLYLMIAVSGWLISQRADAVDVTVPLVLWFVSLALNAAWSALFFGLKRPDLAFVDVVLLWLSIALMIVVFMPIDARAAWLLVPYLAWVSFASALNLSIWQLNKAPQRSGT
ncbi:TspO/MBR family protein [Zavarzinia sp. CC-PAN008]|uniref:TspO/MBR family protein n=1 Tax=Zavarzinia sp. CC-PAN008 TaxID=3243332 RepID=UPI003F746311